MTATVSDGSLSASQSFAWTIQNATSNNAPSLSNPGTTRHDVGESVVLQLNGGDSNGDPLTYGAAGLPPGLQLTPSTGRIAGVPTTAGTYSVTVSVSDGALSASQAFTLDHRAGQCCAGPDEPGEPDGHRRPGRCTPTSGERCEQRPADVRRDRLACRPAADREQRSDRRNADDGRHLQRDRLRERRRAVGEPVVHVDDSGGERRAGVDESGEPDDDSRTVRRAAATGQRHEWPDVDVRRERAALRAAADASTGRIAGRPTTAGTYSVTATVSDGALSAQQAFTWTIRGGECRAGR